MRNRTLLILFLLVFGCLGIESLSGASQHYNDIVVLVPSYNNAAFYKWNLDSILSQDYPIEHFKVFYIDDVSPDGTADLVQAHLEHYDKNGIVKLVRNPERRFAMANLWRMIHSMPDNVIILTLDGDDAFAHKQVLSHVNNFYNNNPGTWMTWGQFQEHPYGRSDFCEYIPESIVRTASFRSRPWVTSHLRTFRAWLFKQVKLKDLLYDGQFLRVTWDMGMLFPMLEMAKEHGRFINEILYLYNRANPISDQVIYTAEQNKIERIIRNKQKYEPIITEPIASVAPVVSVVLLSHSPDDISYSIKYLNSMLKGVHDYIVVLEKNEGNENDSIIALNGWQNVRVIYSSGNYIETLKEIFGNLSSTHCFVIDDQIKFWKPIDLSVCCNAIKKTHAHSCYVVHTAFMEDFKYLRSLLDIDMSGFRALQYKYFDGLFIQRNIFTCNLYKREALQSLVELIRTGKELVDLDDILLIAE